MMDRNKEVDESIDVGLRSFRQGWETGYLEGAQFAMGKSREEVLRELRRKFGEKGLTPEFRVLG